MQFHRSSLTKPLKIKGFFISKNYMYLELANLRDLT